MNNEQRTMNNEKFFKGEIVLWSLKLLTLTLLTGPQGPSGEFSVKNLPRSGSCSPKGMPLA